MSGVPRWLRITFILAALGVIGAAFMIPTAAVPRGGRTLEGWITGMGGLVLAIAALGLGTRWHRATTLTTALVLGMAGQLGLTSPLWIQYFRLQPWEFAAPPNRLDWAFLACVVGQALVVVTHVGRRRFAAWWGHVRAFLTIPRLVLALIVFAFAAANITQFIQVALDRGAFPTRSYAMQLLAALVALVLNVLNTALLADALPAATLDRLRDRAGARLTLPGAVDHATRLDRALPWIVAAWVLGVTVFIFHVVFELSPHIPDELSYLFQAECFARGRLTCSPPASPEAFNVYLITIEGGRWFATTPPGWPAVLAIGSFCGVPWLVNPLLGALAIPLAHALARRLMGRGFAHALILLLAVSPWFLFLSASYMTHAVSLVLMLIAWLALAQARDQGGGIARPLMAGAALGYLCLVRQLDAVLVGGLFGLWILGLFGRRLPWKSILAYGLGCVAVAAVILVYNRAMTGHPIEFPINAYTDKLWYPGANRLGFGADVGNPPGGWGYLDPFPGHGWRDVLVNTNQNAYATNVELFGWALGSLLFAVVHAIGGRRTRFDNFLLLLVGGLFAGYHLYWFSGGPDFGARYWYLMIIPLVWLTLRGLQTTAEFIGGRLGDPLRAGTRLGATVLILGALTLLVFLPWRAVARYRDYREFHADYRHLTKDEKLGRCLVLVKTKVNADFWSAFILDAPTLDGDQPIFAQDVGEESNRRLMTAFPDRPVYRVDGRSMTGTTLRVTRRPG